MRRLLVALAFCSCAVAASAGAAGDVLGPVLDPDRLTALPREGLAAQAGGSVVVATGRGRVLGHLRGFRLLQDPALDQLAPGPRPLLLLDSIGDPWELRGGKLTGWRTAVPLARGARIARIGRRWTFRGARLAFVSDRRDLVTVSLGRSSRVYDLRTGRSAPVPSGCRAAARQGARWLLLCGYPFGDPKAASTVQVREADGRVRLLFGPAEKVGSSPAGWWTAAFLSPDGSRLLLQWSGQCELPVAFLALTSGGAPRPATGERTLARAPESVALGWSGRRAVVDLPRGGCAGGSARAGTYLVDPSTLERTYVFRRGRFWRSVS